MKTIDDIEDFNYTIEGDTVNIHCYFKDKTFDVDPGMVPDNRVLHSWSVPLSEIEGLEDPTDYLKQAILAANSFPEPEKEEPTPEPVTPIIEVADKSFLDKLKALFRRQ